MSSPAAYRDDILMAIVGPLLVDCVSDRTIPSATVLVGSDGRILATGPSQELAVPAGVPAVDASGKALLPGLIDAHVHLAWDKTLYSDRSAEEYQNRLRTRNPDRDLVRAAHHAQLALAAGVTTVRDCGADDFAVVALRDAINAGEFIGPRILASGRPITTTGGHIYSGWGVDSADQARDAVRFLAGRKVDFIKLVASGGTTTPGTNVSRAQYSLEEMKAAVDEAHRLGLHVAVHAISTDSIRLAAEAGVDTIEHCSWIGADARTAETDTAAVDWMLKNRVRVNHAIIPRPSMFPGETGRTPSAGEYWMLNLLKVRWPFLRYMREQGVCVSLATDACLGPWPDTDFWPGFQDLARACEVMVSHAAFSPAEALAMVTREAARLLDLGHEIGTIERGKQADLILVARDPLEDIRALRDVEMVFRGGRLVAQSARVLLSRPSGNERNAL